MTFSGCWPEGYIWMKIRWRHGTMGVRAHSDLGLAFTAEVMLVIRVRAAAMWKSTWVSWRVALAAQSGCVNCECVVPTRAVVYTPWRPSSWVERTTALELRGFVCSVLGNTQAITQGKPAVKSNPWCTILLKMSKSAAEHSPGSHISWWNTWYSDCTESKRIHLVFIFFLNRFPLGALEIHPGKCYQVSV